MSLNDWIGLLLFICVTDFSVCRIKISTNRLQYKCRIKITPIKIIIDIDTRYKLQIMFVLFLMVMSKNMIVIEINIIIIISDYKWVPNTIMNLLIIKRNSLHNNISTTFKLFRINTLLIELIHVIPPLFLILFKYTDLQQIL